MNKHTRKWAEGLNRQFSKEDIQMANNTHEKMFNITNSLRNANQNYYEEPPHTSQNGHHQKVYKQYMLERVWREGTLLDCWWECKLVQPLWKTLWRFLKKLKIELPFDPAIPLLGIYPEKTMTQKDTCGVPFIAQQK